MKIILQDCKTAEFLRLDSTWSMDIKEAYHFLSVPAAVYFGMKELLKPFRIVETRSNAFSDVPVHAVSREFIPWRNLSLHPAPALSLSTAVTAIDTGFRYLNGGTVNSIVQSELAATGNVPTATLEAHCNADLRPVPYHTV